MSKKRDKEISLSEKLSSLIHTKPSVVESEDEDITTIDKIAPNENDSDYSADELDVPKFRKLNNELLVEDDNKYSGKGISRRDLNDSAESDISDDELNKEDSLLDDDDEEEEEEESQQSDDGSDEEIPSDSEASEPDKTDDNNKLGTKGQEDLNFNNDIILKAASDIEKGRAIKNQLHIWDFLLECRMKFQKCLAASNQLPNHKNFVKFKSKGGTEFQSSAAQCRKSLRLLLNSLLSFQDALLKTNEDFVSLSNNKKSNEEEIESDSDECDIAEKDEQSSSKKLGKLNDFSEKISKRHEAFKTYRNNTIQKWNDKTRIGYISNKNFSAFEQSTLKQIEHVLLDKERLIKRTQTKRTNYHILGQEDQEPPPKKPAKLEEDPLANSLDNKSKILQREIFDDDDFYHQLLSDLVKRKANDVTDPVQLGKQWMQLQKVRSKMKKTVDVKASKGRKVRFVVHPKLVNFMMPIDNSVYNEESKVELFNSLFGKSKN